MQDFSYLPNFWQHEFPVFEVALSNWFPGCWNFLSLCQSFHPILLFRCATWSQIAVSTYANPTRNRHIYEIINISTLTKVTIAEYSTFFKRGWGRYWIWSHFHDFFFLWINIWCFWFHTLVTIFHFKVPLSSCGFLLFRLKSDQSQYLCTNQRGLAILVQKSQNA